ncbi:hypothetical protein [Novosphingobium guangzhouense]|uniref:hypothetical protein n=1 Tax=Novosphingobium guangzhouense TaxID=1850347 RepID=UPI0011AF8C9A|nr:hypothetical protein [Novosphingobium guangzhouense]
MNNSTEESDEPFKDAAIAKLAEIAGVAKDLDAVARLKHELVPLGREFRRIISITPSELDRSPSSHTLTERLDWIDTQVLNPLDKLIPALGPDCRHLLSLWPQEVAPDLMPDLDEVTRHLEHLRLLARHVAVMLVTYRKHDLPHGLLIRNHIVVASAAALDRALPNLKPSRGTYDKKSKKFDGRYPHC